MRLTIIGIIAILVFASLASAVNYIKTDVDDTDISLGNNGEMHIHHGEGNVGLDTTPKSGNSLYILTDSLMGINASSSAGGGYAALYATTSADYAYGIFADCSGFQGCGSFTGTTGVEAISGSGTALFVDTDSSYAATFDGGNVGIGTLTPISNLSVGGDGVIGAAIFGQDSMYGIYGNCTGNSGDYGVRGNGGAIGVGVKGVSQSATGVSGIGQDGMTGTRTSGNAYGTLGTASFGAYGQYNTTYYGYLGGAAYGAYGLGNIGLYAIGSTAAANLSGNLVLTNNAAIEVQGADRNMLFIDNAKTILGHSYGGTVVFGADGPQEKGFISAGGLNVTYHIQSEPIFGMWFPDSTEGGSTSDGDGYWNFTDEKYNTNSDVFERLSNGYEIAVDGATYPGFYRICWSLTYGFVAEGSYIRTYLQVGGSTEHDTLHGGTASTYHNDFACVDMQINLYSTIRLQAASADTTYARYGTSSGAASYMYIRRLN